MQIQIQVAHVPNQLPSSGTDSGSTFRGNPRINGADELRSLLAWLRREEWLRGSVSLTPGSPGSEEMGNGYDVLTLVLGSGGTVALLARALSIWLSHRSSDVALKITRPDGQQMEIEARRVRDVRSFIEDIQELLEQPDLPGTGESLAIPGCSDPTDPLDSSDP